MSLSSRITMPGQVWSVAASDPSGPLYVTSYGASPLETVVTTLDMSGVVAWRRTYAGAGRPLSRMSADGVLWVAYPEQDGWRLEGILPDGSAGPTVRPDCGPDEEVGAFVLLDDGFCIAWAGASRLHRRARSRQASVPQPRVAGYTGEGACLWSTPILLGAVSHPGVVEMGRDTGWAMRPHRPWVPKEVGVDHCEPLLVSGTGSRPASTTQGAGSEGRSSSTWTAAGPSRPRLQLPRAARRSQVRASS